MKMLRVAQDRVVLTLVEAEFFYFVLYSVVWSWSFWGSVWETNTFHSVFALSFIFSVLLFLFTRGRYTTATQQIEEH